MSIPSEYMGTADEPIFYTPLRVDRHFNYYQRKASHYHDALTGRCQKRRGQKPCEVGVAIAPPDPTPDILTEFEYISLLVAVKAGAPRGLYGMDLLYKPTGLRLRWVTKALTKLSNDEYHQEPVLFRLSPCCGKPYSTPFLSSAAVCIGCHKVINNSPSMLTGVPVSAGIEGFEPWIDFAASPLEEQFRRYAFSTELELFSMG